MISTVLDFVEVVGRGKAITDHERGQVKELVANDHIDMYTVAQLRRSIILVRNCHLRGVEIYQERALAGNISWRTEITNVHERAASEPGVSVLSITRTLPISVSRSTVWRAMKASEHLVCRETIKQPHLTHAHKAERFSFAATHITWTAQWHTLIFSGEKRFHLDGSDGGTSYWYDPCREPRSFFSSHRWVADQSWFDVPSPNCTAVPSSLSKELSPLRSTRTFCRGIYGLCFSGTGEIHFQQDNAPSQVACQTLDWLRKYANPWTGCRSHLTQQTYYYMF